MNDIYLCKISDIELFMSSVFGNDDFLRHWPALKTDGVIVQKIKKFYYVLENNKVAHDSAFFSQDEINSCMTLTPISKQGYRK